MNGGDLYIKYTTYSTSLEEDFKTGDSFYKYVNKYLRFLYISNISKNPAI